MSKTITAWHVLSTNQAFKKLESNAGGLSSAEAAKRLSKFGFNELSQGEKFSLGRLLLAQLKSPFIYILLVASLVNFIFRELMDAYVILAIVFVNVIIGFIQEYKTNQSLNKLRKIIKKETIVIRNGQEQKIETKFLVPGDVIVLQAGNRIPADGRLVEVNDFEVNEATLTGESWPGKKSLTPLEVGTALADRQNMVFMGTLVVEGRAQALVTVTGSATAMGQIATMLRDTKEEPTPLQKKLDGFSKGLIKLVGLVAIFIFLLGLWRGNTLLSMFGVTIALAVAIIPEGLLITMTMILTVGMQRILKHNGLVRRLVSAETLGSTTVICTDKTGTLTEGEMRVTQVATFTQSLDLAVVSWREAENNKEMGRLSQIAWLCNDAVVQNSQNLPDQWLILGSPTEKAILLFAGLEVSTKDLNKLFPRLQEVPFDSQHKFMMTRHSYGEHHDIIFLKGAPEKVLAFSNFYLHDEKAIRLEKDEQKRWQEQWEHFSRHGLRVLAGAYRLVPKDFQDLEVSKENPQEFVFVGLWGLSDPLRLETRETLQKTLRAGIRTVIITGDNKYTAHRIAKDLGLANDKDAVVTGEELLAMSDKELNERIKEIKIFARVTPADKLRIVRAWQSKGEIVSMTGDGVNDAPALKAADIGVAVSSGSDIARETADLVLLDNNFGTIVMSIKEGRVIFANIKKVILYFLSGSFSEAAVVVSSLFLQIPLPLLAAQILWINLVADVFPALALTMDPEEEEIMNAKQTKESQQILDLEGKFITTVITLTSSLSSLWLFLHFWRGGEGNLDLARTLAFTAMSIGTLFYVFSIRNLKHNIFKVQPFNNKYLNGAVLIGLLIQLGAVYLPFLNFVLHTVPLSWFHWQILILVIIVNLVIIELVKALFIKYYGVKRKKLVK
jgi:Ca2+-transporting ATPase